MFWNQNIWCFSCVLHLYRLFSLEVFTWLCPHFLLPSRPIHVRLVLDVWGSPWGWTFAAIVSISILLCCPSIGAAGEHAQPARFMLWRPWPWFKMLKVVFVCCGVRTLKKHARRPSILVVVSLSSSRLKKHASHDHFRTLEHTFTK